MSKDPRIFLEHIQQSIGWIENFIKNLPKEDFLKAKLIQDGIVRNLEIIGEAVKNLPDGFKNSHPDVPWKDITGMRDNLIHEYFGVDLEEVWKTATIDLPVFKKQIEELLK